MKRLTAFIYGLFLLAGVVFGQERIVCDETCEIELPRNWDTLMNELGYQPLDTFRL